MYYQLVTAEDIYHHGIKGQKWGVRRYQNKDGSLTKAGKKRYGSYPDLSGLSDEELHARLNRMNKERSYRQAVADTARLRRGPSKVKSALAIAEAASSAAGGLSKASIASNKYKASKTTDVDAKARYNEKALRSGQNAAIFKETGNLSKNLGKFAGREKKAAKMDLSNLSDEELNERISRINLERSYLQMMNESSNRGAGRERTIKVLQDIGTVAASAASVTSIAMTMKSIMDTNKKKN